MKKIETIWHHILNTAVEKNEYRFTQQDIAREYGYSLSTVYHALTVPEEIGSIRKEGKFFILQDWEKLLFYWASYRSLMRDIVRYYFVDETVQNIEALVPNGVILACYSAVRKLLRDSPSDYDSVYMYANEETISLMDKRFDKVPLNKRHNITILLLPNVMETRWKETTSLVQTFVDIWNLPDWYSRDYYQAILSKLYELLS